jgi:hypothetical protein
MVTHTADPECIGLQYPTPFRADPLPFPIAAARRSTASRSFSIDATILSCSRSAGRSRRPSLFHCSLASLFRYRRGCFFLLPLPFTALLLFLEGCSARRPPFHRSRGPSWACLACAVICFRGQAHQVTPPSGDRHARGTGRQVTRPNFVSQFCRSSSKRAFVTGWPLPVLVGKRICTRYDAGS